MKKLFPLFTLVILLFLSSCQTRVVSLQKPLQENSLELYQKYTFVTQDAKMLKMKVLKVDETKIYGKDAKGETIELEKTNVREAKKLDLLSSVAIGLAAIAAVIFVPI